MKFYALSGLKYLLTIGTFKFSKWRQRFQMKNNHNELHNGYYIWVIIQDSCRVIMKMLSFCFRLLYCILAAGFAPGPKAAWSGELSDDYTATVYVYCNNGRRNCRCQCKIIPGHETAISKTLSCIGLNFQRPGQLLQDWIVICCLDVAVDWYQ